jgi:hypothetical protein
MERRTFVRQGAVAAAALALPGLLADPDRPLAPLAPLRRGAAPVRVRGRVLAGDRGLPGVTVTDGVSVTVTDRGGAYTLIADGAQPWVSVSLPAGYRIPTGPAGTAAFFQPLRRDGRGEMSAVFTLQPLAGGDAAHGFLVLADPQTQNAFEVARFHQETVPDVRATVDATGAVPMFGVGCGDLMFDDLTLMPEYERAVRGMGIPFFQVIGNHDLVFDTPSDERSSATFERHFGPTYYSFDRGDIHYVVLDDVFWYGSGYLGYLSERQQLWLRADLARIERGRTVVVFVHIPPLSTREQRNGAPQPGNAASITNREALYRLLEPYRAYVLSGHTHEHERHGDGGVRHHVHGTVCGAWWSGDICWDGTPNGYGVYEARGSELRWRYKATGRPASHQMRLYRPGADPTAPGDLVANVWDADDSWTVVWYEDGERRGLMSRRVGHDPLAVEQQTGPEKPPRREWVEPTRTGHLYYAAPSKDALEARVEATDPWGNRYSEAIALRP